MKSLFLIPFLIACLSFNACTSVAVRKSKQISLASAAISDSIKVHRYDLTSKYSAELNKLVDPVPVKQRIKIASFHVDTKVGNKITSSKDFVVLPTGTDKTNLIIEDSQEYKDLVAGNKVLQKQLADEHDKLTSFSNQTNKILMDQAAELQKEKSKGNIFHRFFSWIKTFFGVGMIGAALILIGGGVLCAIFPPLLPIIEDVFSIVWKLATEIFNLIMLGFKDLLDMINIHIGKK